MPIIELEGPRAIYSLDRLEAEAAIVSDEALSAIVEEQQSSVETIEKHIEGKFEEIEKLREAHDRAIDRVRVYLAEAVRRKHQNKVGPDEIS